MSQHTLSLSTFKQIEMTHSEDKHVIKCYASQRDSIRKLACPLLLQKGVLAVAMAMAVAMASVPSHAPLAGTRDVGEGEWLRVGLSGLEMQNDKYMYPGYCFNIQWWSRASV